MFPPWFIDGLEFEDELENGGDPEFDELEKELEEEEDPEFDPKLVLDPAENRLLIGFLALS